MNVSDNQKRWMVFGIALNKVLITEIRAFVEQEIRKEYGNLQTSCSIHTQSYRGRLKKHTVVLKYENINGNDTLPKKPGGKYDYPMFDYRVTSYIDFAKLYVENHMAKFNAFNEHCDASAVLALLGKVPVFPAVVQTVAGNVRKARNAWAHCAFSEWNLADFRHSFADMEQLVKSLGLPSANETAVLRELKDWQNKGAILCMNATVDPDLVKTVEQHLISLKNDVDKQAFEKEEERQRLQTALLCIITAVEEVKSRVSIVEEGQRSLTAAVKITQTQIGELESQQEDVNAQVFRLEETLNTRVSFVEQEQLIIKENQNTFCERFDSTQDQISKLQSDQEDIERHITYLGDQNSRKTQISYEIASCEADIKFFAERHHPDTRKWFLNDFHRWFENPGDSRAYVLLGDAGVGKSVMAGVLAQKSRTTGKLAAAYFCRNDDGTRNNPRYLLGTIACELCKCNDQYGNFVGGEGGIRNCLGRSEMGIQELFTKLLQEPLAKCSDFCPRKLIIIDALDETKDESRGEFLDLIMHRFLMLPKWLVFFITSRPVDTVQLRLKNYHPCIKICLGNSENFKFYQQHELDIRLYLEKSVDFSRLPYSAEDVSKKCNGLFLFAYCIARVLKDQLFSGKMGQLTDLFPDIGEFFLQNFKRIFHKVGEDLYTKLLGCALAAPSPLPVSFITYILQRENSGLDEQEVIDAFSTFLVVRTSDQTFAFLHSLIPSWLTVKKKSSVRLFVDRNKGGRYLRDIISEVLSAAIANQQGECPPFMERDVLEYCDQIGVRLLCDFGDSDSLKVVFSYATNYQVIARRLKKKGIEIYSIIGDLKFAVGRDRFTNEKKGILQEICLFLESNVYVLLQSPHLLQCCLREASKTVQENLVFTESIGATKIEHSWLPFGANEIPKEIVCFAFSPDKKVIAGASGKSISFFDACMLKLVQGPFTVTEMGDSINHLKFSPDGKFLFFGRLDKWFSMKEGCVKDFPQFANNKKVCYKWISFLQKPPYITVQGDLPPTGTHFEFCLINIFCWWATYELRQMYIKCGDSVSIFDRERQAFLGIKVLRDLLNSIQFSSTLLKILLDKLRLQKDSVWNVSQLCPNCLEFEQRNEEKTLELVRQRVLDLYPDIFEFQVWNVESGRPVLEEALFKDWDNFFLCHVSAVAKSGLPILLELLKEKSFCTIAVANLIGYLFPSTLLLMQSKLSVSQETVRYILSTFRGTGNAVAEFLKGTVIRSGNLFVRKHKETLSSLRDVPKDLGQFLLLPTLEGDVNDTSISSATVLTFLRELRKTVCEGDIVPLFPVQSVVFSQSGGLVACHLGPKLLIYKNFGSFSSLWYEDQCECDSCHSVFSPDSTLLLHCIQNRNDKPRFQVWNVFSRALSVTFDVPAVESLFPPVDCCCLSSDNTKLIVCGGFSIEIWEYDASPCRLITRIESPVLILNYNKFTYCTVSPETNLLACCITDRIALCPMNTPTDQSIRLLPLAHLGKVEFCQFVKGGRYLISYGVDGNVFLWDLNSCVAITYANVCQGKESIVGLSRSCEGDTFTFLTSSGRFGVLTLCGLEHSILPKLPTLEVQSEELMSEESCGQQREQYGPIAPTHATHDLNVAAFLEEMEFMCDSEGNSESSDDCDDVETLG